MPGKYVVTNRGGEKGWGGFALPFPPTTGPLTLEPYADCVNTPMSRPLSGDATSSGIKGIYTTGVADCSVIIVVEYTGGAWHRYYFHHVIGSYVTSAIIAEAKQAMGTASGANLYGLVAQYYGGTAFGSADGLFDALQIPQGRRSYYKSNHSGMSFGFRFDNGRFGEVNPWTG